MFYIDVILIPVIAGIIYRLLFIRKDKGYYASVFCFLVTLISGGYAIWLYTWGHSGGNEGPGLLALAVFVSFIGCLVGEIICFIYRKRRI